MAQQRPHGASCTRRIGAVLPALYASARGLSHRAAPRTPPPVLSFTPCSRRVSRHATSNQELRAPKLREARRTARAIARRSKRRANARRARHREPARARREGACRLDVDFPSLLSPLVRPPPFLRCGVLRVGYVPLDRSRSLRRFVASCRSESHACAKKARLIVVVEQRRRVEHARTHPQRRGIARAVRGPSTGSARARFCGLAALRPLFEG